MEALRPETFDRLGAPAARNLSSRRQKRSGQAQEVRARVGGADDPGTHPQVVEVLRLSPTVHALRAPCRHGEQVLTGCMPSVNSDCNASCLGRYSSRVKYLFNDTRILRYYPTTVVEF